MSLHTLRDPKRNGRDPRQDVSAGSGFTLIEVLIVIAIIVVMVSVSIPAITRYLKHYRLKGATQQVATELAVARSKAIMKNVRLGVVFAVVSDTEYRWVIEDDQAPQTAPNWFGVAAEDWPTLTADPAQAGVVQTLPARIVFDAPDNCPGMSGGADSWGVRFTQMGSTCSFGATGCSVAPPGASIPVNRVRVGGGAATVCLFEGSTGLRKTVAVTSGGRIMAQK